ncbi:cytochrome P450 [Rhizobium halophilum]|uniref:cytochrome P450 n=1 Tax=Rhizobium halophilum TaxID=2846852 RepID=UPI001EFD7ECE|nr:cytochrome P450 [Rhizobium halophilum]MCF6371134.1 cytochrome P450 [Rhizobium halophilum]
MTVSVPDMTHPIPPIFTKAELDADPHAIYHHYRDRVPFLKREDGAYLVLRARDVQDLLSDTRTRQMETELLVANGITSGPLYELMSNSLLYANGDVHRRRRQPLTRAFAFKMMAELRPKVRNLAHDLLNNSFRNGGMRLKEEYAALIPAITIAAILGVPRQEVPHFTRLVYEVSKILTTSWTRDELPAMEAATRDLITWTEELISERRRSWTGDFLSEYVARVDDAGEISSTEAVMQIVSVILGGSDTTRAAIVVQTGLLLDRRELWNACCADQLLNQAAVLEALRYEPAVGSVPRLAISDICIDGYTIPAGSPVLLATISSMRDPSIFQDPMVFDIHREQPRWPLVFGGGEHRCLGEALARIELEEALLALTMTLPDLQLAGAPLRVHGHAGIRRVEELEVSW